MASNNEDSPNSENVICSNNGRESLTSILPLICVWKLLWTSSTTSRLFLAIIYLLLLSEGNTRHYYIDSSDEKLLKSNSKDVKYQPEFQECYITVQETRKVGGQCVKIKDNFQGCVAGSLIDPFHQACL